MIDRTWSASYTLFENLKGRNQSGAQAWTGWKYTNVSQKTICKLLMLVAKREGEKLIGYLSIDASVTVKWILNKRDAIV
jgi:hypothetical protein